MLVFMVISLVRCAVLRIGYFIRTGVLLRDSIGRESLG